MDLKELQTRYNQISNKIKEIELDNAFKRKKRQEYREEISKLGFDPDKLDEQIVLIQKKISDRLLEIEQSVINLEKELL